MTNCILSLPLRTVTDKQLCSISSRKEEKILQSLRQENVTGTPYFLLKRPASAFDIFQSRFNNNTVCNYGALRVSI